MSFEIKTATRQGVKPLVGMFGESGSGKHGEALAKWCSSSGGDIAGGGASKSPAGEAKASVAPPVATPKVATELAKLKKELWDSTKAIHATVTAIENHK